MILKIVYGAGSSLYINDVKTVSFTANHAEDAVPTDVTKPAEPGYRVVFTKDYLNSQIGCSPEGDGDNSYYLNQVRVTTPDSLEETIFFTGSAYLCDDKGNTVDSLR